MSEAKDPAIKLFGTTIPLSANEDTPAALFGDSGSASDAIPVELEDSIDHDLPSTTYSDDNNKMEEDRQQQEKEKLGDISTEREDGGAPPPDSNQSTVPAISSGTDENPKTPVDKETATPDVPKAEEGHGEATNSQDKTLKKPDKILPCPRCNSMDTKFCYYNNYNVNQPRHFCKNCQRYWTAGGTMRNVPVGAGRRKTKSSSNYRHINVPEALQTIRSDPPDGVHHPPKPNATVLSFGSDTPLSESMMASALNLAEKTMSNCTSNGYCRPAEHRISGSCGGGEIGDDYSCGSSAMGSNITEEGNKVGLQDAVMGNCHGFPPQMPCFPGAPWSYPWNPTQWNPAVAPPAFCPPTFPVSFYPTPAYWGCAVPGTWNAPWFLPPPSTTSPGVPASGPNSPTLGKHSRDGNMLKQCNSEQENPIKQGDSERCLWIPKTLRIDDPVEAARSSIWATLGIKNDKADSSGGGLFKAFQSKGDEKNHMVESSHVLQANPAALSRSLNFHENS